MYHNAVSSSHKDLMRLRLPRRRNYADRAWRVERVRDTKEYEYWACVIFRQGLRSRYFVLGRQAIAKMSKKIWEEMVCESPS